MAADTGPPYSLLPAINAGKIKEFQQVLGVPLARATTGRLCRARKQKKPAAPLSKMLCIKARHACLTDRPRGISRRLGAGGSPHLGGAPQVFDLRAIQAQVMRPTMHVTAQQHGGVTGRAVVRRFISQWSCSCERRKTLLRSSRKAAGTDASPTHREARAALATTLSLSPDGGSLHAAELSSHGKKLA